jgi:outer membrane protein
MVLSPAAGRGNGCCSPPPCCWLSPEALKLAEQQVQVAEEGLAVARDELAQARRRYEAGVTGNLEVVEAQARLARSGDSRTDALYAWTAARLALFQSLGTIQELGR